MTDTADIESAAEPRGPGAVPIDAPCLNAYVVDVVIVEPSTDAPVLSSIDPDSAEVGAADVTVRLVGSGFTPNAQIVWNGGDEPTVFVSATELTTVVRPSTATGPAAVPVLVRQGARRTDTVTFTFTEQTPPDEPEGEPA